MASDTTTRLRERIAELRKRKRLDSHEFMPLLDAVEALVDERETATDGSTWYEFMDAERKSDAALATLLEQR